MKRHFHFIAFCFLATPGLAQILVSPGSLMSIQPNTVLFNAADFSNQGTVVNNGLMMMAGAWSNSGLYQAGPGQINFDGAGPQIINHNAQSINTLIISGGGNKQFKADIFIQKELKLQSGILSTDNHSKILIDEQAIISGASANSYVDGAVYNTGTGQKFFPVGTNGHYLPATLQNISGTSPTLGIEVIEPNSNIKVDFSLLDVSSGRYWKLTTASGTFAGSPANLALLDEVFSQPTDKIVIAQADDDSDPFQSLGQSDFAGSIQSGSVSSKEPVTKTRIAIAEEKSNDDKSISVYNAVTPGNNDGKHDFLKIVNIEFYPANEVSIVNRWGEKVFEMRGYNNTDRVFDGDGNVNGAKALSDGTYYYVIKPGNGDKKLSGFFVLRR